MSQTTDGLTRGAGGGAVEDPGERLVVGRYVRTGTSGHRWAVSLGVPVRVKSLLLLDRVWVKAEPRE